MSLQAAVVVAVIILEVAEMVAELQEVEERTQVLTPRTKVKAARKPRAMRLGKAGMVVFMVMLQAVAAAGMVATAAPPIAEMVHPMVVVVRDTSIQSLPTLKLLPAMHPCLPLRVAPRPDILGTVMHASRS